MRSLSFLPASIFGLIFAFVIFLCYIPSGSALFCYQCSSVNDSRCMDPFTPAPDLSVNCSIEYPMAKYCRKIDQTVKDTHRVFRRCAWEDHKKDDCYYGTNNYYKAKICICTADNCNTASAMDTILPLMLTSGLFVAVQRFIVS